MSANAPQNIVEAYRIASQTNTMESAQRNVVFEKVIEFCENDKKCKSENSLKRNTLLFWAYNRCAQAKFEAKEFEEAVKLWFKAVELTGNETAKIEVGDKILKGLEKADIKIRQKAKFIAKIALIMANACQKTGLQEKALRMERLQNTAEFVLKPSKFKH